MFAGSTHYKTPYDTKRAEGHTEQHHGRATIGHLAYHYNCLV